jgi:hypothetical protein
MRRVLSLIGSTLVLVAACGGEGDMTIAPAPVAPAPTTSSAGVKRTPDGCVVGSTHAAVISKLGFTREAPAGHAPGFNLDGREVEGNDPLSCFKSDLIGEDGEKVDNQLARLIPAVDDIVHGAVDGLVAGAINDGNLLVLLRMDGAESLSDASCVNLQVQTAKVTKPSLGTDGAIEGYQTYDPDPESQVSNGKGKIVGGTMTSDPFELAIPIKIFDVSFIVHVHGGRFRYTIDPETGHIKGYFGGGIETQEILDGVSQGAGVDKILPMIRVILNSSADMAPDADGKCTQISAALSFEAAPAFIRQ